MNGYMKFYDVCWWIVELFCVSLFCYVLSSSPFSLFCNSTSSTEQQRSIDSILIKNSWQPHHRCSMGFFWIHFGDSNIIFHVIREFFFDNKNSIQNWVHTSFEEFFLILTMKFVFIFTLFCVREKFSCFSWVRKHKSVWIFFKRIFWSKNDGWSDERWKHVKIIHHFALSFQSKRRWELTSASDHNKKFWIYVKVAKFKHLNWILKSCDGCIKH